MLVTGYHTLEDRDNVDEIEASGPKQCIRPDAWLGNGYYFWDSDIQWAHSWGKMQRKDYMIFKALITVDENTFDLVGNIAQKLEFAEIMKLLNTKGSFKQGQTVTVPKVIEYIKKHIGFPYNSIRAADIPPSAKVISFGGRRGEYMYTNDRVQICLINKNNLNLGSFKVIYPDIYVE